MMAIAALASWAQTYVETFDDNSLGWTETDFNSNIGSAIVKDGVLTIKSKGEDSTGAFFLEALTGSSEGARGNTFFETHCYAPLDVKKPFEVTADVKINKLSYDKFCGFMFNYRDTGNFYCFTFDDKTVEFTRFFENRLIGKITQSIRWADKKKVDQVWKLVSDGEAISFLVDGQQIMKVKFMPLDYSGIGFFTFGKQTLIVDEMTFTQK